MLNHSETDDILGLRAQILANIEVATDNNGTGPFKLAVFESGNGWQAIVLDNTGAPVFGHSLDGEQDKTVEAALRTMLRRSARAVLEKLRVKNIL